MGSRCARHHASEARSTADSENGIANFMAGQGGRLSSQTDGPSDYSNGFQGAFLDEFDAMA